MIRPFIIYVLIIFVFSANAQEIPPAIAKRLLDLPGTYVGKMPCADCSGIDCSLTLQCDSQCAHGRYMRIDKYLNTKNGDQANKIKGKWSLIPQYNAAEHGSFFITLYTNDTLKAGIYEVKKDGNLLPVDNDLHKIEAPMDMTLKKL